MDNNHTLNDVPVMVDNRKSATVWLVGLALVTLINSCAAVGIALLPLIGPQRYRRILDWCIGLGVGSLSGSAVFHLLPNAVDFDAVKGDNPFLLWLLIAGVYVFYVMENVIKFVTTWKRKAEFKADTSGSDSTRSPADGNVRTVSLTSVVPLRKDVEVGGRPVEDGLHSASKPNGKLNVGHKGATTSRRLSFASRDLRSELVSVTSEIHCAEHNICGSGNGIASVAWMIIIGDSVHNFIDGLSIGAAFNQNLFTGISISIAVLCEEFPHELGDVAILISSGMSVKQALFYNVMSAMTCYVGFIVGMLLGGIGNVDRFIFAFAGGMFLFISLGNMLPEMNAKVQHKLTVQVSRGAKLFLVQSSGIFAGILCLFALAMVSEYIQIH